MKKSICIVGSNGFIGGSLSRFLFGKEYEIIFFNRSKEYLVSKSEYCISDALNDVFKNYRFEICINAAGNGNVQTSISQPSLDFNSNVCFTQLLLEAIRNTQTNCTYIHLSSAAVYGNPKTLPIMEDSELKPISPYGFHKVLSENLCRQYTELYGMQSIILRPFSVYGPGLRKQLIWDVHQKFFQSDKDETIEFFGDGNETRDFIYIEDLCQIIELLINKANQLSKFEVFNISNDNEVKTSTIIELIARRFAHKTYKFSGITREGDPKNWKGNNSKAIQLGYSRNYSLEQGLEAYTNWYLKSRIDK